MFDWYYYSVPQSKIDPRTTAEKNSGSGTEILIFDVLFNSAF